MERAEDGYVIQVGDVIEEDGWPGKQRRVVHRVTKTMALVRYNEKAEGKFPRVFGFGFGPKPYTRWSQRTYRVLKAPHA